MCVIEGFIFCYYGIDLVIYIDWMKMFVIDN